ncbi:hypothetical protein [Microbulbifer sp. JSM ZJ756]|uniref:DUF7931 domain-containing protein n=1 Tax=Microbulbifer sp. JSM ZJ756 TaxID=3376191 RepID=UPI003787CB24
MPDRDTEEPNSEAGPTVAARPLENAGDFRTALVELLQGARRRVFIFSGHLAHELYSDHLVAGAISEFARRSRYAQLQILVRDSDRLAREFNRTHNLAQRLSSRIQLRCINATAETPQMEFVLGDTRDVLLREDREQWLGVYAADDRVRARRLAETFQQQWEQASEDPALRRLFL